MGQRTLFELHVRVQVDLGSFCGFVTKPKRDHRQIYAASKQRHGRGMPKRMRRDRLFSQRRTSVACRGDVARDEPLESIGTESSTA